MIACHASSCPTPDACRFAGCKGTCNPTRVEGSLATMITLAPVVPISTAFSWPGNAGRPAAVVIKFRPVLA